MTGNLATIAVATQISRSVVSLDILINPGSNHVRVHVTVQLNIQGIEIDHPDLSAHRSVIQEHSNDSKYESGH